MCLLEWDLFLQWWKGVEWRIPRSKDWPLIKAGIYDHHRNGAESFGSPLKRKHINSLNWLSAVLVSGTETIVKFWYRSGNFYCQNFILVFLSNLFSISPPLFSFFRKYEFFALKSLNLNTDPQKQSKNLQYLARNLVLQAIS